MKILHTIHITLFLCSTLFTGYAQQGFIDSLLRAHDRARSDTQKVNRYNELCWDMTFSQPDTAIKYGKKALLLAVRKDYKKGMATAYNNMGILYYFKGNYKDAIYYYDQAFKVWKELDDKKRMASVISNLALIYNIICDYDKAIKFNFQALKIREEIRDSAGIAKSLNNIGTSYHYMEQYNIALKYYFQALKLKKIQGDELSIASSLNNIGLVYFNRIDRKKVYLDSALMYLQEALSLRKLIDDKVGLAESYTNLGNVYSETGKQEQALELYNKALDFQQAIGDADGKALTLHNLGNICFIKNNFPKALDYYHTSLDISLDIMNNDLTMDNYRIISQAYAEINQFKKAYEYSYKYARFKDSVFTDKTSKQIAEIETRYEVQKKENQLLKQEADIKRLHNERNKIIIYLNSIITISLLVVAIVIFRMFKKNRKTSQILQNQNNEIAQSKKLIIESINYAKKIQNAILPYQKSFQEEFPDSFIINLPKNIIGGDFIWFQEFDGRKFFAMIDCTGHGVPGALMSIICNDLLNKIIQEDRIVDPSKVLKRLDLELNLALGQKIDDNVVLDGMDIALYLRENSTLKYAGAHMPFCLISEGNISTIRGEGYSIGGFALSGLKSFKTQTIHIKKGDVLYMFTDGYMDQFGGKSRLPLKFHNFRKLLYEIHKFHVHNQKQFLEDFLFNWKRNIDQTDDIIVAGVVL